MFYSRRALITAFSGYGIYNVAAALGVRFFRNIGKKY